MRDQRAQVSLNSAADERYEPKPVDRGDFRILVLGDFGARGDGATVSNDTPRRIDRDDLDAHVSRVAPRLRVEVNGAELDLGFASMDDFHPDRLVTRLTTLETQPSADGDPSTAELLRGILHHPRVQSLEATWRAMEMLADRLDTDGQLHLFMLDVPRDQIAGALERVAHRSEADGESWALAISLHDYPEGDAGADLLARGATAARALATPLIAAAPASFAGRATAADLDDDSQPAESPEVYTLIRRSLEARYLGLTFPRLLLRLPYGRENPCDTLELEELDDPGRHEHYLWGSGAVAVALLVGAAFNERGWEMGSRMSLDVSSLPLFIYKRGREPVAMSCAEIIMSERAARHLVWRGLMPLAWIRDTDRVRLVELRSVAEPEATLAAPWAAATSGSA